MTDEEYLRARGWEESLDTDNGDSVWQHDRRPGKRPGFRKRHTTAEAIEAQLTEDRECLAFVLARSHVIARADGGAGTLMREWGIEGVRLEPKE